MSIFATKNLFRPDPNAQDASLFYRCYPVSGMGYFQEDFNKLKTNQRYFCTVRPAPTSLDGKALGVYINNKLLGWVYEDMRDDLRALLPSAVSVLAYVYNTTADILRVEIGLKMRDIPAENIRTFALDGLEFFASRASTYSPVLNYECRFLRAPNKYNKKAVRVKINDTPVGFVKKSEQEDFDRTLSGVRFSTVNMDKKEIRVIVK